MNYFEVFAIVLYLLVANIHGKYKKTPLEYLTIITEFYTQLIELLITNKCNDNDMPALIEQPIEQPIEQLPVTVASEELNFIRKVIANDKQKTHDAIKQLEKHQQFTNSYPQKYLDKYDMINRPWEFTTDETEPLKQQFTEQFYKDNEHNITLLENELEMYDNMLLNPEQFESQRQALGLKSRPRIFSNKDINRKIEMLIEDAEKKLNKLMNANDSELNNWVNCKIYETIVSNRMNAFKNSYVMDLTPNGNVILGYSNDKSAFIYYSDKTIPYRYLDSVARKFVITFNCPALYIDMRKEHEAAANRLRLLNEAKRLHEQRIHEAKAKSQFHAADLFATFKTYNSAEKTDTTNSTQYDTLSRHMNYSRAHLQENNIIGKGLIKQKSNYYLHCGKLTDFNFLQTPPKPEHNEQLNRLWLAKQTNIRQQNDDWKQYKTINNFSANATNAIATNANVIDDSDTDNDINPFDEMDSFIPFNE